MTDEDEALETAMREAATGPAQVSVDGVSVQQQDPLKQIAVSKHLASKSAMQGRTGFRLTRLSSPGTT
jgi:hypothetical protein